MGFFWTFWWVSVSVWFGFSVRFGLFLTGSVQLRFFGFRLMKPKPNQDEYFLNILISLVSFFSWFGFFSYFFSDFLELISCRFFCSPLVWSILPSQGGWCLVSDTYKMSHLMNLRTLMVKYFFFRENSIIFFRDFENKYTIESQDSSSFIKDSLCIYIPWVSL